MNKIIISLLTIIIYSHAFAEELIVVRDNPDVYIYKPEYLCIYNHVEGTIQVDLVGTVVEEVNGKEVPVPGVKFSVEPNTGSARWDNQKIIFISNNDGEFLATLYINASIIVDSNKQGKVCHTRRNKLRVEKKGYKTRFLWFDSEMPEVKIFMEKDAAQQDGSGNSRG